MVNIGKFDPNQHEPARGSFDPMPAGWVAMIISDSEVQPSEKKPQNQFLKLTFDVIESMHPDFKGRQQWDRLNIWNDNPKAVDIAYSKLTSICRAVGVNQGAEDFESSSLHNRPLAVKLKLVAAHRDKGGVDREARNEITDYDSVAARFQQSGAPIAPAQAAAAGVPVAPAPHASPATAPPTQAPATPAPVPGSPPPWAQAPPQ